MKTLYIAGPSVFNRNKPFQEMLKRKVSEAGFLPLYPLDTPLPDDVCPTSVDAAMLIRANNLALIERADGLIACFEPFRGPSLDVGTAYEVGYAQAKGKPVFAYTPYSASYKDRVVNGDQWARTVTFQGHEAIVDGKGMLIEDFGLSDNLMLCAKTEGGVLPMSNTITQALEIAQKHFAHSQP